MEVVMGYVLGAILFLQGCQYLSLSHPRSTGIVGAAGAILLSSLVAFKPLAPLAKIPTEALVATAALWAIYAGLVAAVGLWDFDTRGFGLFGVFAAVISLVAVIYGATAGYTLLPILCSAIATVAFAMVFIYAGTPIKGLQAATGWVLGVAGVAMIVLHGLAVMKVPGLL